MQGFYPFICRIIEVLSISFYGNISGKQSITASFFRSHAEESDILIVARLKQFYLERKHTWT